MTSSASADGWKEPADLVGKVRLQCTHCKPHPRRYVVESDTVVRCADCGKRHSKDSLTVIGGVD